MADLLGGVIGCMPAGAPGLKGTAPTGGVPICGNCCRAKPEGGIPATGAPCGPCGTPETGICGMGAIGGRTPAGAAPTPGVAIVPGITPYRAVCAWDFMGWIAMFGCVLVVWPIDLCCRNYLGH